MARIEYIEHRLLNWARWLESEGSGKLGYAAIALGRLEATGDRYREAVIPTDDDDARKTDQAVAALGQPYTRTLQVVYVTGRNQAHQEYSLGCSASTIKSRVWEAHRRLAHWFTDQAQQSRERRDNLERLQRSARP